MITLSVRNPDDGTASYDKIKVYRSDTQTGTYAAIATVAIDLTYATEFSTGFTTYTDTAGDTTKWYEFSYYQTSGAIETPLSSPIQGGTAYLDTRIRIELSDADTSAPNYPFFSNQEIADARQDAVNALYPHFFKDTVDKSLTTVYGQWTYTLPAGIFNVESAEIWDQTQTPYAKITDLRDFDIVDNQLTLKNTTDVNLASGYTIYLYGSKRITDSADVPEYMDEMLISKACAVLLRHMLWDRSKYQRYTTIIRPDGGNMPSIQNMLKYYEAAFANRRNEVKKGMPAREMDLL